MFYVFLEEILISVRSGKPVHLVVMNQYRNLPSMASSSQGSLFNSTASTLNLLKTSATESFHT